jgi:hypothetical protein
MSIIDDTVLGNINKSPERQWDKVNRLLERSDNPNMHGNRPSTNTAPTRRIKRVRHGIHYSDQKTGSICRTGKHPQTTTPLPSEEGEQIAMSGSRMSALPGENKPWDLLTRRETTRPLRLGRHLKQHRPAAGRKLGSASDALISTGTLKRISS